MDELLRVEARPRHFSELTRTQRPALRRILDTLDAAVRQLPRKGSYRSSEAKPTRLDEERKSRIFLLNGEAGTGKTTVYLSLRRYVDRKAGEGDAKLSDEFEALRGKQEPEGTVPGKYLNLRHHLVWLEPLTLEEAANTAPNYLAAILARIDRVLADELGPGSQADSTAAHSFEFDQPKLTEALSEFQRLRTDIGLAWDGNMPSRGIQLDPEVFAEEVMRAEGARIQINRRFDLVLEKLTDHIYRRNENPLFVLPVDDLSVSPGPSIEILRLLRMISVPRLFILALGDESTFEELVFQKVLGELVDLAGEQAFKVDRQRRVLMARARDLSFQAQRKLIPPSQRATIEALHWDETLGHFETNGESSDCELRISLWKALRTVPLKDLVVPHWLDPTKKDRWTLLEFLAYPGESRIDLSKLPPGPIDDVLAEPVGIEDAYTGLQVLEVPMRHAVDLSLGLTDLLRDIPKGKDQRIEEGEIPTEWQRNRQWQNRFFGWIRSEALRHLNEQNYMSGEERELCEEAIRGPWYTSGTLDTTELKVRPDYESGFKTGDWPEGSSETQTAGPLRAYALVKVRPHRRWRLGPKRALEHLDFVNVDGRQVGTWSFMPPRPLAWFVLLHDLLALIQDQGLQGEPLVPGWCDHQWAGTNWESLTHYDRRKRESRSRIDQDTTFLPWPVPEWPSFWQFDCFLAGWNAILAGASEDRTGKGHLQSQQAIEDHLLYWWVRLGIDVFRVEPERHIHGGRLPGSEKEPIAWDKLWEDLNELAKNVPSSSYYEPARQWFIHLGILAAPEYGIQKDIAEQILDCKAIASVVEGDDAARYIRRVRARTINRFFPKADTRKKLESAARPAASPWNALYELFHDGDHRFGKRDGRSGHWFPTARDLEDAVQNDRETRRWRRRRAYLRRDRV